MNTATYSNRLNRAINRAPRITLHCPELQRAYALADRKARAAVFARNNPQPAVYFTGHTSEAC